MRKGIKRISDFGVSNVLLSIVLIVASVYTLLAYRIVNIGAPLANEKIHSFRQTETAIVVQDWFRNGFDLFNYSMPVFGRPWSLMFECPIYQAIVYGIMRIFGATVNELDIYLRAVDIAFFYIGVLFLILLISELTKDVKPALTVGIIYVLSLYNVYWSRSSMIDFTSVTFGLMYIYFIVKFMEKNTYRYIIFSLLFGIMAYLQKSTTMFGFVVLLGIYIVQQESKLLKELEWNVRKYLIKNYKRVSVIVLICIVPVLLCIAWNHHADLLKESSVYTSSLTSSALHEWNYGTLKQRISINQWITIIERIFVLFGREWVCFALILGYSVISERKYLNLILALIASTIVPIAILFNLYYVHDYYLIAVSPFVYSVFGLILYEIVISNGGVNGKILLLLHCFLVCYFISIILDLDMLMQSRISQLITQI